MTRATHPRPPTLRPKRAATGKILLLATGAPPWAAGRKNVPYWTGYGVATSGTYSVTEAQPATSLRHFFGGLDDLRSQGKTIGVSFVYMLQDTGAYGSSTSEQPFFGLYRSDASVKPAAATLMSAAACP